MTLYQATVAKNNQKVTLTLEQGSKDGAREYLHTQWYSILSLEEKQEVFAWEQQTKSFFFVVKIQWQEKKWQIHSLDILKAYKKLTEDLSYEVISIYEDPLSTREEIAYSTAKAREIYLELQGHSIPVAPVNKVEEGSSSIGPTILEKEVIKYQLLLEKIYNKLITLVETHSILFWEDRSARITLLASAIKQARQVTNINKLKVIGEAALLKIWALELEITWEEHEENKKAFISETNALLRGIGSKSRINPSINLIAGKLQTLKEELFNTSLAQAEGSKPTDTKDKSGFTYFKNLRELSLYEQSLKSLKKELRPLFFSKSEKKQKLLLKQKLLKQNIRILQSRLAGGRFSYMRVVKGLSYYNDLLLYLIAYLANFSIFLVASTTLLSALLGSWFFGQSPQMNSLIFLFCLLSLFGLLFKRIWKTSSLALATLIYLVVVTALSINF